MEVVMYGKDSELRNIADKWWSSRGGNKMPAAFVSSYGFMAFKENRPVCSVHLWPIMETGACMWGLHVADPESTKEERGEAIGELCMAVEAFARGLGYVLLVGYPKRDGIKQRFKENGFIETETGASQCVKRL